MFQLTLCVISFLLLEQITKAINFKESLNLAHHFEGFVLCGVGLLHSVSIEKQNFMAHTHTQKKVAHQNYSTYFWEEGEGRRGDWGLIFSSKVMPVTNGHLRDSSSTL